MDKVKARKRYEQLDKTQLIELLIVSREEIEKLNNTDKQIRIMKKLANRIKRALRYINHYTSGGKYMTENEKELIEILQKGRGWFK